MKPMYRHPGPAASRLEVVAPDEQEPADEIRMVRWLEQMRADVAESIGGVMLRGARPVPLTVLPTVLSGSPGRLVGWSLRVPVFSSNPGVVKLRDGRNADGDLIAVINLPAASSVTEWMAPGGVSFSNGLYVEIATGAGLETGIEGAVFLGAAD
jgi:hypothetical protein